jgi:biopolymer transport protein ExbD
METWKFRKTDRADQIEHAGTSAVKAMIEAGILGDGHEFLPPKGVEWVSFQQALVELGLKSSSTPDSDAEIRAEIRSKWKEPPLDLGAQAPPAGPSSPPPLPPAAETSAGPPVPQSVIPAGRVKERSRPVDFEGEIDMTPMIDMTFLLLVFFMVAATVGPAWRRVSLPPATSGDTQDPENRVVVVLDFAQSLTDDEQKPMTGSKFTTLADARLRLVDVGAGPGNTSEEEISSDQLAARLKQAFDEKPAAQFVLVAHRKMPAGTVREVLKQAKRAGAKETLVGVSVPH